jgi:hypothetical protein
MQPNWIFHRRDIQRFAQELAIPNYPLLTIFKSTKHSWKVAVLRFSLSSENRVKTTCQSGTKLSAVLHAFLITLATLLNVVYCIDIEQLVASKRVTRQKPGCHGRAFLRTLRLYMHLLLGIH